MDYAYYSSKDFLTDDCFVNHQLSPTSESTKFWDQWLIEHPDKQKDWQQAIYLLEAIQLGLYDYARAYITDALINELLEQIKKTNLKSQNRGFRHRWFEGRLRWIAVACFVSIIVSGAVYWTMNTNASIYDKHVAALITPPLELENTTDQNTTFFLPDGSKVHLGPYSKLSYSQDFNRKNRQVYLTGLAIFEVRKDIDKPFLVFANQIVARVMGTRFKVNAYDADKEVKVSVESGQVSVFQENKDINNSQAQFRKGLILLPNQEAVFLRQTQEFNKTIIENPVILPGSETELIQFSYDEIPISQVFSDLEKAYGIPIRLNNDGLANCELSASLANVSFEQKLDIICKTVKANYERFDGQIIISGGSCQ